MRLRHAVGLMLMLTMVKAAPAAERGSEDLLQPAPTARPIAASKTRSLCVIIRNSCVLC